MEKYPDKIIPRHQLEQPFYISNRNIEISNTEQNIFDQFITTAKQPHPVKKDLLAELHEKKEGQQMQQWFIEHSEDKLFTIRNQNDLYLTFSQVQHQEQYFVKLNPLKNGPEKKLQEWLFVMAENKRYTIENSYNGKFFFLTSAPLNKLLCRPKACSFEQRYLQNWKLSPIAQPVELPPDNRQDLIKQSEKVIKLLSEFKGKIYNFKHPFYQFAKQTYASSSLYQSDTCPYYLAYPQDVEDIRLMLKVAKLIDKKIVARSGGHQYSGMSSGRNNTIILVLDKFNTMQINNDKQLELGPSNTLKKLSKFLKSKNISIPHGQCPLVNVGGHAQTGGYGHFIRSFGLFADYCQGFDIVLACGTLHRIRRPTEIKDEKDQLNFQIYRGVLGGNAGSFGIVVKYYFSYIKDDDHPESFAFCKIRFYSESLFKVVMHQFQKWSVLVAKGTEDTLKGYDLFLTVSQSTHQVTGAKKSYQVIILQGIFSHLNKGDQYDEKIFKDVLDKFKASESQQQQLKLNLHVGFSGKMKLSEIGHRFVRTYPQIDLSGRQFDLPFQKRINVTFDPLKDQYIKIVSQEIAKMFKSKQLYLIVQMFSWGGAYKEKGNKKINNLTLTSFPQRNAIHCSVYDIFHTPNEKGKKAAENAQSDMQKIVDLYFSKGNKKLFWGSFGDVDMTKHQVVAAYYDSCQDYVVLQKLKQKIDPTDVFHTLMTVKLPSK